MSLDRRMKTLQGRFALFWIALTVLIIYWFVTQSQVMSGSDLGYIDQRLDIIQSIVVISGVSFSVVFLALFGVLGRRFYKRRRR